MSKTEVIKTWRNKNHQEKNVLIDFVTLRKFTKSCAQKLSMQNTDSFADNVTIVTTTTIFVNFANKFIPVQLTQMMTINGLDVTLAVDGYFYLSI